MRLSINPTASTPGSSRTRRSISAISCMRRSPGNRSDGMPIHVIPAGALPNPGSIFACAAKLRRKSAAVTSSTRDVAVCATTSALRIANRLPGLPPAFSFLMVSMTLGRVAWIAGSRPKRIAATTDARVAKARIRASTPTSRLIGSGIGSLAVRRRRSDSADNPIPTAPPISESSSDSASSWRTSAPRPAPIARRMAISRSRSRACASRKDARFAHATMSTSATTIMSAAAAGTIALSMSGLTATSVAGTTTRSMFCDQLPGYRARMSAT